MAKCDYCGKEVTMPYTCGYCGSSFCPEHRLPENHSCDGLDKISEESEDEGRIYRGISDDLKEYPDESDQEDHFSDFSFEFERGGNSRRPERDYKSQMERRGPSFFDILKSFIFNNTTVLLVIIMVITYIGQALTKTIGGEGLYSSLISYLAPSRGHLFTRPWTLVTSIFLHSVENPFHLFINGIFLFFLGPALERRVGRKRFLYIFLGGGVLAAVAQLTLVSGNYVLLGASGALFAVIGGLTAISPRMPIFLFFILPMPLWVFAFGFGAYELIQAFIREDSIAHIAHFSGLIVGLLYGYKLRREFKKKFERFSSSPFF